MSQITKTKEQRRAAIFRAEEALLSMPQMEFKVKHFFVNGMYARELFLPKGAYVTGKIHKKDHLVIISYGSLVLATEDESEVIFGPCTFIGKKGSKRAVYAQEDTLWTTISSTPFTSVEDAEKDLVTNSYDEYLLQSEEKPCLSG